MSDSEILEQIRAALLENGSIPEKTRTRLNLVAQAYLMERMDELGSDICEVVKTNQEANTKLDKLTKKVDVLESVVYWPQRHGKLFVFLVSLFGLIVVTGALNDIVKPILVILGVPVN